jgi:hypothetical protein
VSIGVPVEAESDDIDASALFVLVYGPERGLVQRSPLTIFWAMEIAFEHQDLHAPG